MWIWYLQGTYVPAYYLESIRTKKRGRLRENIHSLRWYTISCSSTRRIFPGIAAWNLRAVLRGRLRSETHFSLTESVKHKMHLLWYWELLARNRYLRVVQPITYWTNWSNWIHLESALQYRHPKRKASRKEWIYYPLGTNRQGRTPFSCKKPSREEHPGPPLVL